MDIDTQKELKDAFAMIMELASIVKELNEEIERLKGDVAKLKNKTGCYN